MQIAQKNFYKKLLGRAGEVKATEFLKQKGYKIIKTNFKTYVGEIDVIARDNDTVVFVEVKTRTGTEYGTPAQAVTAKKQEKYYKVASEFLQKEGEPPQELPMVAGLTDFCNVITKNSIHQDQVKTNRFADTCQALLTEAFLPRKAIPIFMILEVPYTFI